MSQGDCLRVLESPKTPEWMTSREIAEVIGTTQSNTSESLRRMLRYGEVEKKKVKRKHWLVYAYRIKKNNSVGVRNL